MCLLSCLVSAVCVCSAPVLWWSSIKDYNAKTHAQNHYPNAIPERNNCRWHCNCSFRTLCTACVRDLVPYYWCLPVQCHHMLHTMFLLLDFNGSVNMYFWSSLLFFAAAVVFVVVIAFYRSKMIVLLLLCGNGMESIVTLSHFKCNQDHFCFWFCVRMVYSSWPAISLFNSIACNVELFTSCSS